MQRKIRPKPNSEKARPPSLFLCLGRIVAVDSAFKGRSSIVSDRIVAHGVSNSRWSSSAAPDKKNTDRLSSVIDAVKDRKIPPELRGQRNAVRSETDSMNIVEQRIWHSREEGQFENLPGKGKPLDLSTNPHANPAEDTLYRILSRNKCAGTKVG